MQSWQHLANRMPWKILDSHLINIFTKNLVIEMSFQMKMVAPDLFETLIKKGKSIKDGPLMKQVIKHYPSNSSNNTNDKPKF